MEHTENLQNNTFKIMVIGPRFTGKSMFINALLGEYVLPTTTFLPTVVPIQIKYDTQKKAIVYFKKTFSDKSPFIIPKFAMDHINRFNGENIPPLEISFDEIKDYISISYDAMGDTYIPWMTIVSKVPYEKVEIFYPTELLKNGSEIIDTPGLDEDSFHLQSPIKKISKLDAIFCIFDACRISKSDFQLIENELKDIDIPTPFFIVNKIDYIRRRDQDLIYQYAEEILKKQYSNFELFLLSATEALNGRLKNDKKRIEESGILKLENQLTDFFTEQLQHDQLQQDIDIPSQLSLIKSQVEQKVLTMDNNIQQLVESLECEMEFHINDMIHSISDWVFEYSPEETVRNIVSSLKQKLIDEMQYWKGQILNDEPESKLEALMMNTEKDFASIFTQIDKLTVSLTNETSSKKSIPFWTRAACIDEDSEEPLGEIDIDSSDLFNWLTSDQFVKRIISDDSLSKLDAKSDQWQKQLKSLISEQTIRNIFESKDYRRAMSIATDIGKMFQSIKQLIIDNISQEISELSQKVI